MKNVSKLILAALAVSSFASANLLADDVRTVERYNNHGASSLVYWQGDQAPSVAVYAQGQGVGYNTASEPASPRFTVRDNGHGSSRLLYRAE